MTGPAKTRKSATHDDLVMSALLKAKKAVSAYDIIAALGAKVRLAPPTVYRALDRLIEAGRAHRVESLNAFVACCHKTHHDDAAFAICDRCGTVTEFEAPTIGKAIGSWTRSSGFALATATIELHGICAACSTAANGTSCHA